MHSVKSYPSDLPEVAYGTQLSAKLGKWATVSLTNPVSLVISSVLYLLPLHEVCVLDDACAASEKLTSACWLQPD